MITALDAKTALVLIDLQKGIMGMETAHPTSGVVAKSAELVAAFRKKSLPIVFVNVNPLGAKWTLTRVEKPGMPRDEEGIAKTRQMMEQNGFFDIVAEVGAQKGDIFITKHTWSAFYETEIHEKLQSLAVTGIVLAGVATSIGVEGTARDASERGYNLTFVSDAMTDMHLSAHEHSLSLIFPRIGEIGNTAEIIAKLSENN